MPMNAEVSRADIAANCPHRVGNSKPQVPDHLRVAVAELPLELLASLWQRTAVEAQLDQVDGNRVQEAPRVRVSVVLRVVGIRRIIEVVLDPYGLTLVQSALENELTADQALGSVADHVAQFAVSEVRHGRQVLARASLAAEDEETAVDTVTLRSHDLRTGH